MKRTITLILLLVLAVAAVGAQPTASVAFGVQLGYSIYPSSFELRNPWTLGLRLRWQGIDWLGVEAEVGIGPTENAGGSEVMVVDYGGHIVPNLPFTMGQIQPFGLLGGGGVTYAGSGASTTGSVSAGLGLRLEPNPRTMGGVTLEVRDQLQFNAHGSGLTNVVRIILGAYRVY
jgi:hypothetical protein